MTRRKHIYQLLLVLLAVVTNAQDDAVEGESIERKGREIMKMDQFCFTEIIKNRYLNVFN